jgi:hypothetical protein
MRRRALLGAGLGVLCGAGLGGCTGRRSPDPGGGTGPRSTATEPTGTPTPEPAPSESAADASATATASTSAPTETPVPFPETCEPLPDVEGLPAPPSELTEETAEAFVEEFERTYAVATTDEYGGVDSLRVDSVETVGERYVVGLSFDAVPATPTAGGDGETPTPLPPDAYAHAAVYRLAETRMLREVRSHIDGGLLSWRCWTLGSG